MSSATPIQIPNTTTILPVNVLSTFKTLILPVVSTNPGMILILKDMYGTANTSTIRLSTIGLDYIERSTVNTMTLSTSYGAWTFMNDRTNRWFLTDSYLNSLYISSVSM